MLHFPIQWVPFMLELLIKVETVWDYEHLHHVNVQFLMAVCVCMCMYLPVHAEPASHFSTCMCMHACASAQCLGTWRTGGTLKGWLRETSGQGSDAGVRPRGGREQLIPATHCSWQVQVLQKDLGHSHEALVVHPPVIAPHNYLSERLSCFITRLSQTEMHVKTSLKQYTVDCNMQCNIIFNIKLLPAQLCPEDFHQTTEPAGMWGRDSSSRVWFSSWPSILHSPKDTLLRRLLVSS